MDLNRFGIISPQSGVLSREEMKHIKGGGSVTCTYTINGKKETGVMADGYGQDFADGICEHDETCDDVDCDG
ncbi:hypothetical protein [Pedobacter nototheniae]|uniref:hypothetical protein n=1 Tax=Pedobacter nototheniae TaxID=2488994 RepID=UPI002930A7A3|nr:hypothetical protein [Pedobacter nototheniae]